MGRTKYPLAFRLTIKGLSLLFASSAWAQLTLAIIRSAVRRKSAVCQGLSKGIKHGLKNIEIYRRASLFRSCNS